MKKPSSELLESFVIFVELGSLAKASESLNMTQPALSMQLKRLEDFFEYPLFEFQGKKKSLTPYGVAVYQEAKSISEKIAHSFEDLHRKYSSSNLQTLRVGCRRELIVKTASALKFSGAISFSSMSSLEAVDKLIHNKIDLAVSRVLPNSNEIVAKKFFTSGIHLVIHKKWLRGTSISKFAVNKDFLLKTPSMVYGEKADVFKEWAGFMKLNVEDFKIKYLCEDWTSLLHLIEMGEGYSVMPDTIWSNLPQVEYLPIPQHLGSIHPHYFLYHKGLLKFPAFKNLFLK